MPQFSIIIPCYNQARYLDDAISSIYEQSFSDWEIIIINDGSSDNTIELANKWTSFDQRIILLNQANAGLSAARNTGIKASNGTFISFLDADDKYSPFFLESAYRHLIQGVEVVVCGYIYFNTEGTLFRKISLSEHLNLNDIFTQNLFPVMSLCLNKNLISKIGLFDVTLKSAEDWDFWIRMLRIGVTYSIIPDSLSFYRLSDNSMSKHAFTMYENLKIVAQRACIIDNRIDNNINIDSKVVQQLPFTLRKLLLLCMGVAIMQGKLQDAVSLIMKEKEEFGYDLNPKDFKYMCSYMSFRYRVTSEDLIWVQHELMPIFRNFFNLLPLPGLNKKEAFSNVFYIHRQLINKKKWGFFSPFINRFFC